MPRTVIQFPEWRPDVASNVAEATTLSTLSPYLQICSGVRPREDFYEQHPTLNTAPTNAAGASAVVGAAVYAVGSSSSVPAPYVYAGTKDTLKRSNDAGATSWSSITLPSPFSSADIVSWRFAVTSEDSPRILAATHGPAEYGAGRYPKLLISDTSGTTFSAVTNSGPSGVYVPSASVVAYVGQFAVVGQGFTIDSANPSIRQTNFLSGIQWSSIGNPADWPDIGGTIALTNQSGLQQFPPDYGYVTYIAPLTDRSALVFQQRAIHRMSYVGGDIVWQFDTISTNLGNEDIHTATQIGTMVYFVHRTGFYRTDGQSIQAIGEGKVDRYFQNAVRWVKSLLVQAARDDARNLVYWVYPDSSDSTSATNALIYNYVSERWAYIDLTSTPLEYAFTFGGPFDATLAGVPQGFDTAHKQRAFTSTSTFSSVLRTGQDMLNPGGLAEIRGIRPIADLPTTAPTMQVSTRMLLSDANTTVSSTINTRTGEFNAHAAVGRYHDVIATYSSATVTRISGLELDWVPVGAV